MKHYLIAALLLASAGANADRHFPGVEVDVPPEVFTHGGQRTQACSACCIYENKNYSEGAVLKVEGVLLQCQRDSHTVSTNPLVWRRVKP